MSNDRVFPWQASGELLVLETPEQTRVEYRVAPFGSRMVALLVDYTIVIGVQLAILLLAMLATLGLGGVDGFMAAVLVVISFLLQTLYFVVAEIRGEGTTPGKRRVGLRTVMATGHGITATGSVIRNLARVIDLMPVFWVVPAFARGRRRIGDLMAGTYVVVDRHAGIKRSWLDRAARSYAELEDRVFSFATLSMDQLGAEDLDLIEYAGERLTGVSVGRRRKMELQIAMRYVDRLGLEEARDRAEQQPGRFLQELGLWLRERLEQRAQ